MATPLINQPAPTHLLSASREMRMHIFKQLFQQSELRVTVHSMMMLNPLDQFSVYNFLDNVDFNILNTCNSIRIEALYTLNACTTLNVDGGFRGRDPLANIPDEFLAKIKHIRVAFESLYDIDRRRLPALKEVHIVHEVDGVGGYVDTVDGIMDDVDDAAEQAFEDIASWKWKQRQAAYVAVEGGLRVKMTVLWSCYSEANEARVVSVSATL